MKTQSFAEYVKGARGRLGLSREKFAATILKGKVSQVAVTRWEEGGTPAGSCLCCGLSTEQQVRRLLDAALQKVA